MKVMSICHMFPNKINKNVGVFVKERLKYVAMKVDLTMVAPVPYFPMMDYVDRYSDLNRLDTIEYFDGLTVYHPRYFLIPKYFKCLDSLFYSASMNKYIGRMLKNGEEDILDIHWVYPDGIAALAWTKKYKKKSIVTVRGNEAIHYYQDTIVRKIIVDKLNCFDHVISVSNDLKNKMIEQYNVKHDKITVIPNGVDSKIFRFIQKKYSTERCNLDSNKKYILTISRLSGEKGLVNLIEAMSLINCDNVNLIIIGDGPLRESLKCSTVELGIEDKVIFLGEINHEDTPFWYNAADLFCLPSIWEGCPNVVIESLACGTPVVASHVGGIPDLIPKKDYGILVPPGDVHTLAKALNDALEINWNRKNISDFGSANSWEDVAEKVVNVFEKVLS